MNRRGAALVVALLAMMLAAALATAALAAGQLRWRSGLARRAAARAGIEVESALDRQLSRWEALDADSLPVGSMREIGREELAGARRHDSLQRLSPTLFQLRSVVEIGAVGTPPIGRNAAALLVRLAPLVLHDTVAVLAPAVLLAGTASVGSYRTDSTPFDAFNRDPRPLLYSTTPADDSVVVLQPGQRLVDGNGSGILWGRGSLELSGDFHYAGVVLVEGTLRLTDRARVDGAVLALGAVELSGSAAIQWSDSVVRRTLGAHPVVPGRVPGGWWRLD